MHTGKGQIAELILQDGCRYVRIACPESLVPAPGQYLLASATSDSTLPVPIFYTDSASGGFIATPAEYWQPGDSLALRGPLGRGFSLPPSTRRIALIAVDDEPGRLRGLIRPALARNAAVVMLSDSIVETLPDDVEVQPLGAMDDVLNWADYIALDVSRENLPELRERLSAWNRLAAVQDAQVLIRTPMPCGGIAECGVCAVITRASWQMACKDGPVFDLREI